MTKISLILQGGLDKGGLRQRVLRYQVYIAGNLSMLLFKDYLYSKF